MFKKNPSTPGSTPGIYSDLIEKRSNLYFWFLFIIFYTLSFQTCVLYHHLEKRYPVNLGNTVWLYDLCGLHNRCLKSEARHQWRGGNQAFVAEW